MCQDGEFCFFGEPIGEELPQKKQPASQDFYEVTEKIAVLSDNGRTKKEIRRVRWGEHPVMLDIRKWRRDQPECRGRNCTAESASSINARTRRGTSFLGDVPLLL